MEMLEINRNSIAVGLKIAWQAESIDHKGFLLNPTLKSEMHIGKPALLFDVLTPIICHSFDELHLINDFSVWIGTSDLIFTYHYLTTCWSPSLPLSNSKIIHWSQWVLAFF